MPNNYPANMSGSPCACNSGYVKDSFGGCVLQATCSSGYQPDGFGGCVSACASPLVWNGTSCACSSPYILVNGSCEIETYSLSSLDLTTDSIEPTGTAAGNKNSTKTIVATVTSQQTGQAKYGAVVEIKMDVDATSGGHDHGEQYAKRPQGVLTGTPCIPAQQHLCVRESTDFLGKASFTFTAPVVSGKHTFTAVCVSPACSGSTPGEINVKVDGLVPLPNSPLYELIGDDDKHQSNHYLTPEAATVLRNMAASYHIEDKFWQLKQALRGKRGQYTYTASKLYLNDASLIGGGRFDFKGNWGSPHAGHRRGVVIDVRANQNVGAVPLGSFANFQDMAASYGAEAQVHCTSNKTDGQNRQPPTCTGRDGSQDTNRHFHILLLGVDQ